MGTRHCGKRRKCWLPKFSKGFFFRVVKSRDCVVKGWNFHTLRIAQGTTNLYQMSNSILLQITKQQNFWLTQIVNSCRWQNFKLLSIEKYPFPICQNLLFPFRLLKDATKLRLVDLRGKHSGVLSGLLNIKAGDLEQVYLSRIETLNCVDLPDVIHKVNTKLFNNPFPNDKF